MTLYKVLNEDGSARQGTGTYSLPTDSTPGEWMPRIEGKLVPCRRGYHLCRREDLVHWLGPVIYEAEARGDVIETDDKIVVPEVRLLRRVPTWNERTARLFACDCAERSLDMVERRGSKVDPRSRKTIEVARRFAAGEATRGELVAARDAASAAAWDAAWDAAMLAERRWQTELLQPAL